MTPDMPKDIVNELRVHATIEQISGTIFERAADEIERLRAERDEARRLVCELASEYKAEMFCPKGTMVPKSDRALAKAYGWDCFKEAP
jgi:hypothetical protein